MEGETSEPHDGSSHAHGGQVPVSPQAYGSVRHGYSDLGVVGKRTASKIRGEGGGTTKQSKEGGGVLDENELLPGVFSRKKMGWREGGTLNCRLECLRDAVCH